MPDLIGHLFSNVDLRFPVKPGPERSESLDHRERMTKESSAHQGK